MTCGYGNNDVGAVLKHLVKISNVFTRGATLFDVENVGMEIRNSCESIYDNNAGLENAGQNKVRAN